MDTWKFIISISLLLFFITKLFKKCIKYSAQSWSSINISYFFFLTMLHVGSQFPNQGLNPCPLQWKHGVLITGPLGKSNNSYYFCEWKQSTNDSCYCEWKNIEIGQLQHLGSSLLLTSSNPPLVNSYPSVHSHMLQKLPKYLQFLECGVLIYSYKILSMLLSLLRDIYPSWFPYNLSTFSSSVTPSRKLFLTQMQNFFLPLLGS